MTTKFKDKKARKWLDKYIERINLKVPEQFALKRIDLKFTENGIEVWNVFSKIKEEEVN